MLPHSFWTQFLTPEIHQPQLSLLAGRQLLLPPAAVRAGREGGPGLSRLCSPQVAEKVRGSVRFAFK